MTGSQGKPFAIEEHSMTTITRERAREIVDEIRVNNGGISPADRARTPASVLRSLDSIRKQLGAATQTLATNLYSKDTRFVFELIQNAEDNKYETARDNSDKRFLTFRLCPESIVVDSNEDGFTEPNVRAICSTGPSPKSGSTGYIGEKGIGFKSVFKLASKVHIQSGPFSFFFEHTRGDGGLGMVTPIFEHHHSIHSSNIRTRMTLTLANPSEAEKVATEFDGLPETLLLFLTKLQKITILKAAEEPHDDSETTYSKEEDLVQHRATLTKTLVENRGCERLRRTTVSTYQIKSRLLTNLPTHHARPNSNQAEVRLAFPLDKHSIPIIQWQHVFAFLPIRQVGFTFQIQCDFMTQASREDVERSERNEAILSGVAKTFRDAVLDFCGHSTLQFQWMRYLPDDRVYDPFWAQVGQQIVRLLKETRVLRPWSGGPLKRPDQLKRVPGDFLDEAGDPLFKDMPDEVYLASEYELSDFHLLKILAVSELSFWDISTRVRADLDGPSSRWKSSTTSDDWVTRSASMLMRPYHHGSDAEVLLLESLPLVPLQDGSWVSVIPKSIFHPNSDGVPVPTDLGLQLVAPQALKNSARKSLFKEFGLQHCVPKDVIALILKKYNRCYNVPLQDPISHLRYLYWHLPKEERDLPKTVYLKDQQSRSVYRARVTHDREIVDDLYFETDGTYDPKQLSAQVKSDSEAIRPGFPLHFINRAYIEAVPSDVRRYDMSWEDWLACSAGVRRTPRLVKRSDTTALSEFFSYILKWHPDRLVGTLKAHWASYKELMSPPVILALGEVAVPCDGDMDDVPLRNTYLPLPKLVKACQEVEVEQGMPFLKLPVEIDGDAKQDWKFLKIFEVGHQANTRFYLDVLHHFVQTHQSLSELSRKALLRIYEAVEIHSKADDYKSIRKFFAHENVIYITAKGNRNALWTNSYECVWRAPDFLLRWHSLSDLEGFGGNEKLRHLFNGILDIKDANWIHYISQLEAHREDGVDRNDIQDIYHCFYHEVVGDRDWRSVRYYFEEASLVYEPVQKEWHKPSSCLWTDDTRLSSKVALLRHYSDLQAFFVQRLGVEEPGIDTYIDELQSLVVSDESPSVEKVKDLIKQINSFRPGKGALDKLKPYGFLPVQGTDATTSLKTALDLFAISDRSAYASEFKGKVAVLDFGIEEVRDLRQTIEALHLEHRYMSQLVVELTTVEDSSKEGTLSDSVQRRAYALLRCSLHYRSRSVQSDSLYRKFKATNVYQSDGISKRMTLTLENICVSVEGAAGIVHIEEDDQQLRIYVPRKKRKRKLCYCTELPEKLAAQLCLQGVTAVRVLGDVLTKSSSVIDKLLEHHGIARVSGIEPAEQTDSEDSEEDTEQQVSHLAPPPTHPPSTPVRRGSSASAFTPASASSSTSRAAPSYAESIFTPRSSQAYTGYTNTPSSSFSPFPERRREDFSPGVSTGGHEYRALLDRVIRAASRAPFPRPGVPSPETSLDSDDETPIVLSDTVFGRRSDGKVSHDVKIGAAGELYAFEFLLNHLAPNFDQSNWRSTIRKEVCIHEKYRDMPAWNGRETADITYEDHETANAETTYKLTKLLCEYGYLPNDLILEHQGASLNYYLEVKTTTLGCGTRLFVSKAQYQRMHEMTLQPGIPVRNIYVILRVFNLGQEDMGVRIYVDPAAMERNGELEFQAETYTVVPAVEEEL